MVFFICSHCGASLKKNKVDKHYAIECRNPPHVSCMDCHKEFSGSDYAAHTKCITEDEKYSGKGFVPKPVASKQEEWLNVVRAVRQSQDQLSNNLKTLLDKIISFENIPRKKPKFMNFLNNNRLKIDVNDLDLLWALFEKEHKRAKESVAVDNTNKAAETESKAVSVEVDQESESSPKKKMTKKIKSESQAQIVDGNEKVVPEKIESEATPAVKTKKNKDKNKRKSDVVDDSDMKIPEEMESEEVTPSVTTKKNKDKSKRKSEAIDDSEVKVPVEEQSEVTQLKSKKKKNKLEGKEEVINTNEGEEPAEMQSEEVTQVTQPEVTLTKKQRKEKKKREKYEAELKEIENTQSVGALLEDHDGDEQNKGKNKSKKDKHVNGLDNNVNGISEEKTGESSLKTKKKRNLEDDSTDAIIEKKKKKRDLQDADEVEESAVMEQNTIPQQKFNWNETILEVVKSKGGEIPIKRLRKKVLSEYVNCCGSTETEEKLAAKFSKKLQKVPGVTVRKEVVMLV